MKAFHLHSQIQKKHNRYNNSKRRFNKHWTRARRNRKQSNTRNFFIEKKKIEEKLAEFNAVPTKQFINESYFLYDKSFLIKKKSITATNKAISIYGSFSHFQGKTAEDEIQLLDASNFLKFLIKKKTP